MARDAIARQYDVDRHRMTYTCEDGKGGYRPGVITFFPKPGKSLDLARMEESIRATRLSGGTGMEVTYLDITAAGTVALDGQAALLKVPGSPQQFLLQDSPTKAGTKTPLQRLREAVAGGARVVSVTGRVDGWSGRFPAVLKALEARPADAPVGLAVLDFELGKK